MKPRTQRSKGRALPPADPSSAPQAWLAWAYKALENPICDGCTQCADKCAGAIPMWWDEAEALQSAARAAGVAFSVNAPLDDWQPCPFLDRSSRLCKVYAVRPLVCRLFGQVEWLPCPTGQAQPLPTELIQAIVEGYKSRARRTLREWASWLRGPRPCQNAAPPGE